MKILCVLLLHFPLCCEVLRQPFLKGQPIIITYTAGSQRLVLDCSPELDGLQRDMPLQQALSHKGNASLVAADIPYYRCKFTKLLEALEGISPLVEGIEPGSIYIGVDGLQLIYPDNKDIIFSIHQCSHDVVFYPGFRWSYIFRYHLPTINTPNQINLLCFRM